MVVGSFQIGPRGHAAANLFAFEGNSLTSAKEAAAPSQRIRGRPSDRDALRLRSALEVEGLGLVSIDMEQG
jgi:hypothetical protein